VLKHVKLNLANSMPRNLARTLHFASNRLPTLAQVGPKEATMLNVTCPHCQQKFQFDPTKTWTSPGGITNLKGGTKVVIQCEQCKHWLALELTVAKLEETPSQDAEQP
jgi:hypothetical protein